ncbi:MAG: hypothetical protein CTY20_15315 [Hyphomicrobium sp.]|nr:MAG: hypothetical protein CTY20_15315 [Hyphomicrobium sp.]
MGVMTKAAAKQADTDNSAELRGFFGIAEKWGLSTDQQISLLGAPPRSTFFKWKRDGGALSQDTRERISHVASIYRCLRLLIPDDALAHDWIRRKNTAPIFGGKSALEFMMATGSIVEIYKVRAYLDAQRGG